MKLLVIVVRGLQAAACGPYGNRWIETGTLDALAAQGVVLDQHLAIHPDPGTARRVWRTGRHHFSHPQTLSPGSSPDLLAALRAAGIPTYLLLDTSRAVPADWSEGWDRVTPGADTEQTLESARETLDSLTAIPSWLCWLDLAALLPPWQPDAAIVEAYFAPPAVDEDEEEEDPEGEPVAAEEPLHPLLDPVPGPVDPLDDELFLRMQTSYAAAISHVDALLGNLLDGLADDIHVLLTADHGLSLGEHGIVGLGPCLHQEVVHVPLLFVGPGCRPGRHSDALTASLDLAPTIAELAGVALEGTQGLSLVPLLGGASWPERHYVVLEAGSGEERVRGLRTPGWAVVAPEKEPARLYVRPDDRWEVNDVGARQLERMEGMLRTVEAYVEASRHPGRFELPALEE